MLLCFQRQVFQWKIRQLQSTTSALRQMSVSNQHQCTSALLEKAVQSYLERWPGGDPEEQEDLKVLLTGLQKILLEDKFYS